MDYYCDVCDKTIETISKLKHLKKLSHNQLGKCMRIKYIIENNNFFDMDEIFNVSITKDQPMQVSPITMKEVIYFLLNLTLNWFLIEKTIFLLNPYYNTPQQSFIGKGLYYFGMNILLREDKNLLRFTK